MSSSLLDGTRQIAGQHPARPLPLADRPWASLPGNVGPLAGEQGVVAEAGVVPGAALAAGDPGAQAAHLPRQPDQGVDLGGGPGVGVGVAVVLGLDAAGEGVGPEVGVGLLAKGHALPEVAGLLDDEGALDRRGAGEVLEGALGAADDRVVDHGPHGDRGLAAGVGQGTPVAAVGRRLEVDQDPGRRRGHVGVRQPPLAGGPVGLEVALGQVLLDLEGHVGGALRPVLPIPGRRPVPRVHPRTISTRVRDADHFRQTRESRKLRRTATFGRSRAS